MVTKAPPAEPGSRVLEAYLPATLIGHWARDPASAPVWCETLTGSLMLCDMSGFTAMSERLAALGKEGAELMAGVLNGFFERMLGIAAGWGGVQMKFGGDAIVSALARSAAFALPQYRTLSRRAAREGVHDVDRDHQRNAHRRHRRGPDSRRDCGRR